MILKTVTGPTIREALADARRLFGERAVLLQSTPPAGDAPASVTVAFDEAAPAPRPAPAAAPRRTYGYGVRQAVPLAAEAPSAPAPPPPTAPPLAALPPAPFAPLAAFVPPIPAAPAPPALAPPAPVPAPAADELADLRRRLAQLEAALAATAAPPAPVRAPLPPLVLVGAAGSGRTSLARRIGLAPETVGAASVGVLVVAAPGAPDPTPHFWAAGVPAALVADVADLADALDTLAGAERIVVDTPALPLAPGAGRAAVARLGALLAPLARVEVVWTQDAARDARTFAAADLAALGLRPDALALTRLDEAPPGAAEAWADALALPPVLTAAGPADLRPAEAPGAPAGAPVLADRRPAPSAPRPAPPRPAPPLADPALADPALADPFDRMALPDAAPAPFCVPA